MPGYPSESEFKAQLGLLSRSILDRPAAPRPLSQATRPSIEYVLPYQLTMSQLSELVWIIDQGLATEDIRKAMLAYLSRGCAQVNPMAVIYGASLAQRRKAIRELEGADLRRGLAALMILHTDMIGQGADQTAAGYAVPELLRLIS